MVHFETNKRTGRTGYKFHCGLNSSGKFPSAEWTNDESLVNCKNCRRTLHKQAAKMLKDLDNRKGD